MAAGWWPGGTQCLPQPSCCWVSVCVTGGCWACWAETCGFIREKEGRGGGIRCWRQPSCVLGENQHHYCSKRLGMGGVRAPAHVFHITLLRYRRSGGRITTHTPSAFFALSDSKPAPQQQAQRQAGVPWRLLLRQQWRQRWLLLLVLLGGLGQINLCPHCQVTVTLFAQSPFTHSTVSHSFTQPSYYACMHTHLLPPPTHPAEPNCSPS